MDLLANSDIYLSKRAMEIKIYWINSKTGETYKVKSHNQFVKDNPEIFGIENMNLKDYFEFQKAGILSPEKILAAGWDKLVEILDKGHYVRYDFSTATKLLEISRELQEKYGSLDKLLQQSKNNKDLAKRLQELKGVGPTTVRIFLRDFSRIKRKGPKKFLPTSKTRF